MNEPEPPLPSLDSVNGSIVRMKNHDSINQVVQKYVLLLRQMPPDLAHLDKYVAELMARYKQELQQVHATPDQVETYMKYSFLCVKADQQTSQPHHLEIISLVLINHLRVENAVRTFLKIRAPHLLTKDLNLSQYLSTLKDILKSNTSDFAQKFTSGLEEIESVRSKFSHDLNYPLLPSDIEHMLKLLHMEKPNLSSMEPVDTYLQFCNYCYNFFTGSAWSLADFNRKLKGLPEIEPNWIEFARRYSIQK